MYIPRPHSTTSHFHIQDEKNVSLILNYTTLPAEKKRNRFVRSFHLLAGLKLFYIFFGFFHLFWFRIKCTN